jgi:hypothetical protein
MYEIKTRRTLALTERQKQIGICLLAGYRLKVLRVNLKCPSVLSENIKPAIKKKLLCQNAYQTGSKLAVLFGRMHRKS